MGMTKEVIHAHVFVNGIKKRCRKSDRQIIDINDYCPLNFDLEKVKLEAIEKIKKEMKSVISAQLIYQPHTLKSEGNGCTTREFMIYQDQKSINLNLTY